MSGYKLLVESDGTILYSNDVVFSSQDITELGNSNRNACDPNVLEVIPIINAGNEVFVPADTSGATPGETLETITTDQSNVNDDTYQVEILCVSRKNFTN
jgi:hypothetical protein